MLLLSFSGFAFAFRYIKMKFLVVVLALCVVGVFGDLTDEQKAKIVEYRAACLEETKVDPALVEALKAGNFADDNEALKCYCACFLKKSGIMNADGTYNEQKFREKIPSNIPKEKIDAVVSKCKDKSGASDCETGYELTKCYMKEKDFTISQ